MTTQKPSCTHSYTHPLAHLGMVCTPLIHLHKHAFAVQSDAVRVLIFSIYDFSESQKIWAPRAIMVSGWAQEEGRKTHDRRNRYAGFPVSLIKIYSWRQRTE